jgi:hypothetical protein
MQDMEALALLNDTLVQWCIRLHGVGGGWVARLALLPDKRGALSVVPPGVLGSAVRLALHAALNGLVR